MSLFRDFRDLIQCQIHGKDSIKSVYGTLSVFCEKCINNEDICKMKKQSNVKREIDLAIKKSERKDKKEDKKMMDKKMKGKC